MKNTANEMNFGDLLIYATRNKLRFPFKGNVDVESLWDAALPVLDQIYKTLGDELEQHSKEGLSSDRDEKIIEEIIIRRRIVYFIYNINMQESKNAEATAARNQEKQRILGLIAEEQNEALRSMTLEELQAKLEELE